MKKFLKIIFLFIVCIILVGCDGTQSTFNEDIYNQDLKVYFINVGQADSTFIILPNGENVLIDAGLDNATGFGESDFPSWDNIKRVLELENVDIINHVIITHSHSDHYYYISDIIKNYDVKKIYYSGSTSTNYTYLDLLNTIYEFNVPTVEVYMGQKIIDEPFLQLQVLFTKKENNPEDANKCSVITKLIYGNTSFLFMADGGCKENDIEQVLLQIKADIKCDVLKVGHHGSAYASSEEFLEVVLPQYAVITTAKITDTGHPHKSALNRLEKYSQTILQSKEDGTILFISTGFQMNYYTHVGE